jgi:hypothetical protein
MDIKTTYIKQIEEFVAKKERLEFPKGFTRDRLRTAPGNPPDLDGIFPLDAIGK